VLAYAAYQIQKNSAFQNPSGIDIMLAYATCQIQLWGYILRGVHDFTVIYFILFLLSYYVVIFDYSLLSQYHFILYYLLFYFRKTPTYVYYYLFWYIQMNIYYFIMIIEWLVYFLVLCVCVFVCTWRLSSSNIIFLVRVWQIVSFFPRTCIIMEK
jgi:hypothetical protein